MLTSRDRQIQVFVEKFGIATCSAIWKTFFDGRTLRRCQQRLAVLVKAGALQRKPALYATDYIYFLDKYPRQIDHRLSRLNAYMSLKGLYTLSRFVPEYDEIEGFRPDAYFEIWRDGKITPYFLEIQRNSDFDQRKYERAYLGDWKARWMRFPAVVVLTDQKIKLKPSEVRFIVVDEIQKASLT
jgi:hypothetical protein